LTFKAPFSGIRAWKSPLPASNSGPTSWRAESDFLSGQMKHKMKFNNYIVIGFFLLMSIGTQKSSARIVDFIPNLNSVAVVGVVEHDNNGVAFEVRSSNPRVIKVALKAYHFFQKKENGIWDEAPRIYMHDFDTRFWTIGEYTIRADGMTTTHRRISRLHPRIDSRIDFYVNLGYKYRGTYYEVRREPSLFRSDYHVSRLTKGYFWVENRSDRPSPEELRNLLYYLPWAENPVY
jgi:hypothetical protein